MHDFGLVVTVFGAVVLAAVAGAIWLARRARARRKARRRADPANDYAVRTDWGRSAGTLNYSSFVYFDVDRDGKYGVGDRPMAGIMVRLFDEAGGMVSAVRTNVAGFANFPMSASRRRAMIHSPGAYRFSVSVPPGWRSNSANENQSMQFLAMPGSPAGLGSQDLPRPVGLSPIRRVGGQVAETASVILSVMRNGEVLEARQLVGPGFSFDVADEADAVMIVGSGLDRRLVLSPYSTDLGLLSTGCMGSDAVLETIGFDDVTPRAFRKIPGGYAGLEWRNLNAMSRDYTKDSEGYVNGNVSGDHVAYTSSGYPAEFVSLRPFGFHSVMLSAAWIGSEGETALVESWLAEELVASDRITLSALTPLHYAPMLKAVTRVRMTTKHHWQMVLDDLILAR